MYKCYDISLLLLCRNYIVLIFFQVKEISSNSNVYLKKLDLNSLESVRNFCKVFLQEFSELHILINNAGIITLSFLTTEDGFEKQFGVNHLGHFVLTNLLLERMVKCAPARIINVSSSGHYMFGGNMDLDDLDWKKRKFNKEMAYGQSKLANVLFTKELHRRLADRGVTSYAIHPGAVNTEMLQAYPIVNAVLRNISGIIFKTLEEGAQTSLHCAIQEGLEEHSGDYFENCDVVTPSLMARDAALARALWDKSEEMTKVKYPF